MARKISGRRSSKKQSAPVKYDCCGCCPEGLVVYTESIEDVLDTDCHYAFRENFKMFLRKQNDKNTETDMDFEMKHEQRMSFADDIGLGARCFECEGAYENDVKRGSYRLAMAGRRFISRPDLSNYNWPDDMLEGFDKADVFITHLKDLHKSFGHKKMDDLSNDDVKAIKKDLVVSGYRWVVEQLDAALEEFKEFRDGLGENEREKWDKSVIQQSEKLSDFEMERFESYEEECERFEVVDALIKDLHKGMDDIIARYNNRNKDIDSLVELIEGKSLGAVPKKKKENISRSHKKKNPEKKRKDAEDESEGNINSQQFDTSSLIALDTKFKLLEVEEEVSQNANSVPMMNEYPKVGSSEMQRLMATEVEEASSASPSTPRDPSNDLRPIQVPMPGPNGTQILQTINVPRSVLATASDKPILLTVTPKNGINKGMKQVLVLTKTQPGATKGGPPLFNFSLGQTSPGNVTLGPRSSMATTPPRLPTEPLPPSIKDLQHPLPRQPGTSTLMSGPSLPSPGQISPGAARAPVVRTVAPSSVASPVIVTRALTAPRPGSVVLTSRSQDGQRQVVSSQAAPAGARVGQVMQTVAVNNQDAGRLVVPGPLRGRLVSGQAAPGGQGLVVGQRVVQGQRVMAGQRIVTAGGQSMVVSASGQTMVLPAGARQVMAGGIRQVVQGGTRQLGQVVRQVVPGRQVIVSSAAQVAGTSPQFIRVVSSRAGGQPMVVRQAVPGAVANGGQTLAYRDPNTGVVHNNRVRVVSQGGDLGQMRVVQQVQGGQRLVQTTPVQQRTAVEVGASDQDKPNAPLSRILNALHNRGLVTQHNGKFYYVGDKGKQANAAAGKVQAGGVVRVQGTPSVTPSVAQASHSVVQTPQRSPGVVQTVQAGQSTQGSPSRFEAVQAIPSVPSTPTKVIPPPPVNSFEGQFASFVSKREAPSQSPVANGQTHKLVTLRGMGGGSNIPVSQHTELVDLTGAVSEPSESGSHLAGTKRIAGNVTEIGPMQEKRIKTIPSSSNDFVYYR